MKLLFRISSIAFLCILFSCKTGKTTVSTKETSENMQMSEKEQIEFSYLFYDAMKDKMLGNYSSEKTKLQQALRINPRASAAHYELSLVLMKAGADDLAEISGQNAIRFDGNNKWYKLSLAAIYEANGKLSKLIPLMEDVVKAEPQNAGYQYALAAAYIEAKRFDDARKVYDSLEAIYGINEELAIRKKDLYLEMKKPEKALDEIRRLIKENPENTTYLGILADVYIAAGEPEKALAEYEELLKRDPDNPMIYFSLAEYYRKTDQKEKSFESLKKAFANPSADFELKMQVLSSYFEITRQYPTLTAQALELCSLLVASHPEEPSAHAVYGDFLLRENKLEEALKEYDIVLANDKSRFAVWNQVILIESDLKNFQRMYDLSSEAMELFPNQPIIFLYNGIAAMQLKKYDEAIVSLNNGANVTLDNDPLSSQFYASLGDSYNFLAKYPQSNEAYEKALKFDANNTNVLNNYAYYLSIRKENLERAKELSAKSNLLQPGNSSFEDTYAWILYEMKNYEDAMIWIDKAIESGGSKSSTIIEHKGDILFRLGMNDDALEYWKRAKDLGVGTESLEKKITSKRLED